MQYKTPAKQSYPQNDLFTFERANRKDLIHDYREYLIAVLFQNKATFDTRETQGYWAYVRYRYTDRAISYSEKHLK